MRTWQVAMKVQNRIRQPDGSAPMRNCRSSGKARPRLERGSMIRNGKTSRRPDRTGPADGGSTMRNSKTSRRPDRTGPADGGSTMRNGKTSGRLNPDLLTGWWLHDEEQQDIKKAGPDWSGRWRLHDEGTARIQEGRTRISRRKQ